MRSRFLVAYDISDRDRLRKAHRVMLGFGEPLQYSVFDCRLSEKELVLLVMALRDVISIASDSVLIARLGREGGTSTSRLIFLGRHDAAPDRRPLVL